jgi:hypothetical protein
MNVYRAPLSGQPTPEVIVLSRANAWVKSQDLSYGLQAGLVTADVQVLTWDAVSHKWRLAYDAQQRNPKPVVVDGNFGPGDTGDATYAATHLNPFDHTAAIMAVHIAMAKLLPGTGEQLVLSTYSTYGGSGSWGEIVVLSFPDGRPRLDYDWSGGNSVPFTVVGDRIHASASYWAPNDGHCCAVRTYTFAIGPVQTAAGVQLRPITDGRPYLGIDESPDSVDNTPTLDVTNVVAGAPAAGKLLAGDQIVKVVNPRPGAVGDGGNFTEDEITRFSPGEVVQLLVRRHGVERVVAIRLGSMLGLSQTPPVSAASM